MSPLVWLVLWFGIWGFLHCFSFALLIALVRCCGCSPAAVAVSRHCYHALTVDRRVYLRRLLRAQCYYAVASLMGMWLLCFSGSYPWIAYFSLDHRTHPDPINALLLSHRGEAMAGACAMAIAHWVIAVVEDCVAWRHLAQVSDIDDRIRLQESNWKAINRGLLYLYSLHHLVTIAAFACYLVAGKFSALCCMGLVFELPVFFTNLRELFVSFEREMHDCTGRSIVAGVRLWKVRCWWLFSSFLVILSRYSSIVIFAWSQLFWRVDISNLPYVWEFTYNFFGSFFSMLNLLWSVQLYQWYDSDVYCVKRRQGMIWPPPEIDS